MKLIQYSNNQESSIRKVLSLTTYLFNIMDREKQGLLNISKAINPGKIFDHDIILMPVLHNRHFSLFVSVFLS